MLTTLLPMLLGGGMSMGSGGYGGGFGGFSSGYAPGYGSYGYPTLSAADAGFRVWPARIPLLIRSRAGERRLWYFSRSPGGTR